MGIHGLSSFAKSTGSLWTRIQLKHTKIVIDGSSLLWKLYLNNGIDYQCGGNYDELSDAISRFFRSLECNGIKAFVIIDGPTISRDKKLERLKSRFESSISSSYKLSIGRGGWEDSILPLMAKGTYIQELRNLGVPYVICDCEADQEVASLANQWDCPVISNDSDYFIFDLPAGYIPLSSLDWSEESVTGLVFKRQRLADHLKVRPLLLPLFASLAGNDFIEENTLAPFENALLAGKRRKGNKKQVTKMKRIAELLSSSTHIDEALKSALKLVPNNKQRARLERALEESIKEYVICGLSLRGFLEFGEIRTSLKTLEQEDIPPLIITRYRRGQFSVKCMGVLVSGRRFLHTQVEKSDEPSAHACSSELRRIIYAIIMKPLQEGQESMTKRLEVQEWSRSRRSVKKSLLKPFLDPIVGYGKLPTLYNLEEADIVQRRKLVLIVLQANTEAVTSLPQSFQLFAASVRYWIFRAKPVVNQVWLQALLVVHLNLLDKKGTSFSRSGRYSKLLNSDFDIDCQHSLAQWQAIMMEALNLNEILLDPFLEPKISTLYKGVEVQSVVREIKQGKDPECLVKTSTSSGDAYKELYTAVTEGLEIGLPKELDGDSFCDARRPDREVIEQSVESSENPMPLTDRKLPAVLQGNAFGLLCSDESADES